MRGVRYPLGYERVSQNGYHYIKTTTGWRLKHHIVAEETLGRKIDTDLERVIFKDKNRNNFDPDNILVVALMGDRRTDKRERLQTKIEELQAELDELEEDTA